MTCYVKHLGHLMERAGAGGSYEEKRMLDGVIREMLSMPRNDCPDVWKRVKAIVFGGDPSAKKRFEDGVVSAMVKRLVTG